MSYLVANPEDSFSRDVAHFKRDPECNFVVPAPVPAFRINAIKRVRGV